jgi:hypothetical protein
MSHENHLKPDRPTVSFRSAFFLILVLGGLFIAAVNFVNVMGSHDTGEASHEPGHAAEPTMEATSSQTLEGESGIGKPAADTSQAFGTNPMTDSVHREGQ